MILLRTVTHLALLMRYCNPIRIVAFAPIEWRGNRGLGKPNKLFYPTHVRPAAIL